MLIGGQYLEVIRCMFSLIAPHKVSVNPYRGGL